MGKTQYLMYTGDLAPSENFQTCACGCVRWQVIGYGMGWENELDDFFVRGAEKLWLCHWIGCAESPSREGIARELGVKVKSNANDNATTPRLTFSTQTAAVPPPIRLLFSTPLWCK